MAAPAKLTAATGHTPSRGMCKTHWSRWDREGKPRDIRGPEIRALRRMLGLPDHGPTPDQVRLWEMQEAEISDD